jgi:hypothetical protein
MKKHHAIGIIAVLVAILGILLFLSASPAPSAAEKGCIESGGTVTTAMCCKSTGDFPDTCLIGACGCAPDQSHEVRVCDCGPGSCFDGTACVPIDAVETLCTSQNGTSMTLHEAMALAMAGECAQIGTLASTGTCNSYTGTWWIDLEPFEAKSGCNPACVVDVETGETSVNWRCTGALPS